MDGFKNKKQVIWTIRVKLPRIESECIRVIEIKSSATFLQLHEAIQDAVDFDNDHLFDFFVGRYPENRKYTIIFLILETIGFFKLTRPGIKTN